MFHKLPQILQAICHTLEPDEKILLLSESYLWVIKHGDNILVLAYKFYLHVLDFIVLEGTTHIASGEN